jgi:hypothetical protein
MFPTGAPLLSSTRSAHFCAGSCGGSSGRAPDATVHAVAGRQPELYHKKHAACAVCIRAIIQSAQLHTFPEQDSNHCVVLHATSPYGYVTLPTHIADCFLTCLLLCSSCCRCCCLQNKKELEEKAASFNPADDPMIEVSRFGSSCAAA